MKSLKFVALALTLCGLPSMANAEITLVGSFVPAPGQSETELFNDTTGFNARTCIDVVRGPFPSGTSLRGLGHGTDHLFNLFFRSTPDQIGPNANLVTISFTSSQTPNDFVCGLFVSAGGSTGGNLYTISADEGLAGSFTDLSAPFLASGHLATINHIDVFCCPIEPPTPPIGTTFGPPSSSNPSGSAGEPVNTATGNYLFQRIDLALPGRGLPVVFTRTYNSLDTYSGPLGHGWTHSYNIFLTENMDGTVIMQHGDGHEEFYDPLGGGNYRSRFPGVFSILVKNPDGTFTLTLKDQTQYHFSTIGRLTSITDRNSNALSFSYNADGNLTTITDTVGRRITLRYDNNRIVGLIDPKGQIVHYSYDAGGNLMSDRDPNGGVVGYRYDARHRVTRITDQRGNTLLVNQYDTTGRVVFQTNGRGFPTGFLYDVPQRGDTSVTDPLGNTTIHTYDNKRRLMQVTDALGKSIVFTYDADNNRTTVTDQRGNITRFTYDDRGNVLSITDPLNNNITLVYNARNDIESITNARHFTTTPDYDARGNLTALTDVLGPLMSFTYDSFGQIETRTDARDNVTVYQHDREGNLTTIIDPIIDGRHGVTRMHYDGLGRLKSVTDPNLNTASVTYDATNHVIQGIDPLQHVVSFEYDLAGNLATITDAKTNRIRYGYDRVNNLIRVTDASGGITRYRYDANNNRIASVDANGHSRAYTFDALNRLSSVSDPLGNVIAYGYDPTGNIVAIRDANGTTNTLEYYDNNLLKMIIYGDGAVVTYSYDANGNRENMEDEHGVTGYVYDPRNRLSHVSYPDQKIVSYDYDEVGNQTHIHADGKTVSYDYDALNRLSIVRDWKQQQTHYDYDRASNLRQIRYPNLTRIKFDYDEANRLTRVQNKRNEDIFAQFDYTLDELGNRIVIRESGSTVPERVSSYTYDTLSQLIISEEREAGTLKQRLYDYDPVGNRRRLTERVSRPEGGGVTHTIDYRYDAADRLLQAGNVNFTNDRNGSRLTETTSGADSIRYAYDAANRLRKVVQAKQVVSYTYDGDGNKVEQTVSIEHEAEEPDLSETIRSLNDVALPLAVVLEQNHIKNGEQQETIRYLYGLPGPMYGRSPISEEVSQEPPLAASEFHLFYHSDGLGSTIGLTDNSGELRAAYHYDPWGNLESSDGNVPNRFLFTNEEQDPATSLYYLRARWYDPKVGRFLTQDPRNPNARHPQTLNPYIYVLNNPINLIDPAGLWGIPSWAKKAARAVGSQAEAAAGAVASAGKTVVAVLPAVAGVVVTSAVPGGIVAAALVGGGVKAISGYLQGQTSIDAILSNALQGAFTATVTGTVGTLIKVPGLAAAVWESAVTRAVVATIVVAVGAATIAATAAVLGGGAQKQGGQTPGGPCVDAGAADAQSIGPGPPDCRDDDPLMIRGAPLTTTK